MPRGGRPDFSGPGLLRWGPYTIPHPMLINTVGSVLGANLSHRALVSPNCATNISQRRIQSNVSFSNHCANPSWVFQAYFSHGRVELVRWWTWHGNKRYGVRLLNHKSTCPWGPPTFPAPWGFSVPRACSVRPSCVSVLYYGATV